MTTTPTRTKSFTLVDLLVSIAIIALVMSITLPSLARMKIVQLDTRCRMQVRTVTNGIVGFANEHNRLPAVPLIVWQMDDGPVNVAVSLRVQLAQWIDPCDDPVYQAFTRPWCCDLDGPGLWKKTGVSYYYVPAESLALNVAHYEQNPATVLFRDWKAQTNGVVHVGRFDGSVRDE